jgi:hypothetical protein
LEAILAGLRIPVLRIPRRMSLCVESASPVRQGPRRPRDCRRSLHPRIFLGADIVGAIATVILAIFAIVTARYARKAFLKQSQEVRAIEQRVAGSHRESTVLMPL